MVFVAFLKTEPLEWFWSVLWLFSKKDDTIGISPPFIIFYAPNIRRFGELLQIY